MSGSLEERKVKALEKIAGHLERLACLVYDNEENTFIKVCDVNTEG